MKMKNIAFTVMLLLISITSNAQCAMCRAALEGSNGGVKPEAVNDGIVYLMIFPYLLVGLVGYAIYRLKKKKINSEEQL
mgnify:CR=1 FL=1